MKLAWTARALADLVRLHEFLSPLNPPACLRRSEAASASRRQAAARVVQSLTAAAARLPERPRLGERLDRYAPREVRRILVGRYEMRYEIRKQAISILRLWHTREDR